MKMVHVFVQRKEHLILIFFRVNIKIVYKFTCHHFWRQSFTEFNGKHINQINKQLPHNYYCSVVECDTKQNNKNPNKQTNKYTWRISGELTTGIIVCVE